MSEFSEPPDFITEEQKWRIGRVNLILELHYTPDEVDNLSTQDYADIAAVMGDRARVAAKNGT